MKGFWAVIMKIPTISDIVIKDKGYRPIILADHFRLFLKAMNTWTIAKTMKRLWKIPSATFKVKLSKKVKLNRFVRFRNIVSTAAIINIFKKKLQ